MRFLIYVAFVQFDVIMTSSARISSPSTKFYFIFYGAPYITNPSRLYKDFSVVFKVRRSVGYLLVIRLIFLGGHETRIGVWGRRCREGLDMSTNVNGNE